LSSQLNNESAERVFQICTVGDLKAIVEKLMNIPVSEQRLIVAPGLLSLCLIKFTFSAQQLKDDNMKLINLKYPLKNNAVVKVFRTVENRLESAVSFFLFELNLFYIYFLLQPRVPVLTADPITTSLMQYESQTIAKIGGAIGLLEKEVTNLEKPEVCLFIYFIPNILVSSLYEIKEQSQNVMFIPKTIVFKVVDSVQY
jgi:hypothetical protein